MFVMCYIGHDSLVHSHIGFASLTHPLLNRCCSNNLCLMGTRGGLCSRTQNHMFESGPYLVKLEMQTKFKTGGAIHQPCLRFITALPLKQTPSKATKRVPRPTPKRALSEGKNAVGWPVTVLGASFLRNRTPPK